MVVHAERWSLGQSLMPAATVWCCHRSTDGGGHMGKPLPGVLASWLCSHPEILAVRLVVEVGAESGGTLWVGLTLPAATAQSADQRVRAVWPDLAEALAAYGVRAESSATAPKLEQAVWLAVVPGSALKHVPYGANESSALRFLSRLRSRPRSFSLCVDLRSPGHDVGLIASVQSQQDRLQQLHQRSDHGCNPFQRSPLERSETRLRELTELAGRVEIHLSLHGSLPGSLLLPRLLLTLGSDVGARLTPQTERPPPLARGPIGLVRLLGLMQVSSLSPADTEADNDDDASPFDPNEIPF